MRSKGLLNFIEEVLTMAGAKVPQRFHGCIKGFWVGPQSRTQLGPTSGSNPETLDSPALRVILKKVLQVKEQLQALNMHRSVVRAKAGFGRPLWQAYSHWYPRTPRTLATQLRHAPGTS